MDSSTDSMGMNLGKLKNMVRDRWLDSSTDSMGMNLGKLKNMVRDRDAWHAAVHGVTTSLT